MMATTKLKYCDVCKWEKDWDVLHKDTPRDVELAEDYCEDHTLIYGDDCEVMWCKDCGHLDKYVVTKTKNSKNRDLIGK